MKAEGGFEKWGNGQEDHLNKCKARIAKMIIKDQGRMMFFIKVKGLGDDQPEGSSRFAPTEISDSFCVWVMQLCISGWESSSSQPEVQGKTGIEDHVALLKKEQGANV